MANLIIPTKTVNDKFNLADFQSDFNELANRISTNAASYTAADVLSKLKTVDTDDAGINATTLESHGLADFILKVQESSNIQQVGYKKFCDGLILQWGGQGITNGRAGLNDNVANLPITFPNICYRVFITARLQQVEAPYTHILSINGTPGNNLFHFWTQQDSSAFGGYVDWIAIGY